MMKVKICGITRAEDAQEAERAGADFLGLVFAPSPRQIDPVRARRIMKGLPRFKNWVAVFADQDQGEMEAIVGDLGISYLQLHGHETAAACRDLAERGFEVIKAFRIRTESNLSEARICDAPYVLLDSYVRGRQGGAGHAFKWNWLKGQRFRSRVFLSGGLRPDNVKEALEFLSPFALDVSSGVEVAPGIKSGQKIRQFVAAVRKTPNA